METPTEPSRGRPGAGRLLLVGVLTAALFVVLFTRWPAPEPALGRIGFDLSQLDDEGLYGPATDRQPRVYVLCIPDTREARRTVEAIDTTLRARSSTADTRCSNGEVAAVGNTRQPGWRDVLLRLSRLPFVRRIEPFYAE